MALFKQESNSVPSSLLRDKYGWPPFSILNTMSHDWQRRVDEWNIMIGDSTDGRDTKRYNAMPTNTFSSRGTNAKKAESVSTFDPYLAELMIRWFSRVGDMIIDPFAGGRVRGIVSAVTGRHYTGVDLSAEQIQANYDGYSMLQEKYKDIQGDASWMVGDSIEVLPIIQQKFNMAFTCPPYYNLEQYTRDNRDLSRLPTYYDFLEKYRVILKQTADLLEPNSFFVIVVSEIRADSQDLTKSYYQGLVPDTIIAMRDYCSLHYYNEIILENNIGSLPIRAPKYFQRNRKIGRHHQNILVFYKGRIEDIEDKFSQL